MEGGKNSATQTKTSRASPLRRRIVFASPEVIHRLPTKCTNLNAETLHFDHVRKYLQFRVEKQNARRLLLAARHARALAACLPRKHHIDHVCSLAVLPTD